MMATLVPISWQGVIRNEDHTRGDRAGEVPPRSPFAVRTLSDPEWIEYLLEYKLACILAEMDHEIASSVFTLRDPYAVGYSG
jgi:hypothetical protein